MIVKVNRRADEMWGYIRPVLASLAGRRASERPLAGLDVIDLGIGYGDFMLRALQDGADFVVGADNNLENISDANARLLAAGFSADRFGIFEADLDSSAEQELLFQRSFDVAICTSVLPYLTFQDDLLRRMARFCAVSIVECQYYGDGPGPFGIQNDADMEIALSKHWHSVRAIGKTDLDIRQASRTIWACAIAKYT